jgi:hypothetical protein
MTTRLAALDDDNRPAHTTAPISRELAKVLAAIEELEQSEPGETIAEALAEARAKREARAENPQKVIRRGSR